MIKNLHTLINRPWYINRAFAEGHLPLLFNILDGKQLLTAAQATEEFVFLMDRKGVVAEGGSNNQQMVAVINLKDPIYKYDQECGPSGTKSKMAEMERLKNNPNIAGIVLDIDSGGGQVDGTPEFYDYIRDYPKPVVAYTDGWMCSAAYYIGSASDHIIANKRADAIGSIGAYSQIVDLTGYYEQKGAKVHTIYASESTEKNKSYREVLQGNYEAYIKEELDPIVSDFISDMKATRENISENVFKGAVYSAQNAIKVGLVDSIGTLQSAIDKVFDLSKSQTQNSNNTMNKERKNLQSVLELDGPLASTENGSYLNEEQLDMVETTLVENATALTEAQQATQTAQDALTQEQAAHEATINSLASIAAAAGVTIEEGSAVSATVEAINNRIAKLNARPGETHTQVGKKEEEGKHDYIDFSAPHYKMSKN